MSPKFSKDRSERDRNRDPNLPLQPHLLSAAELPYRINAIPPSRSAQFSKPSSSTATPPLQPPSASNRNIPYRQRLVAAALATPDDQHSSNDSSSAPSSNAVSSGIGASSVTSSSSHGTSKGKGKATATDAISPSPPVVLNVATPFSGVTEFDPDASYFEHLMEKNASALPLPGLSYFERRRAIWKTAPPVPPTPSSPSPSRVKLEALLSQPGAVESEEVWRAGLKNVWKGLVGGNQLRKRLPLAIVLKILQAGWLRDGTWPEGMVVPPWDQPVPAPPPPPVPPDDPSQHGSRSQQGQGQTPAQRQRRAHEQEAYVAALQARAAAEQAIGSAQMMQMQAYAMMGLQGGIPPGYSPSSGDVPEEGYYEMPYVYSETTPPPGEIGPDEQMERIQNPDQAYGERGDEMEAESEDGPPATPLKQGREVESEMDTEDEAEEAEEVDMEETGRMQGVTRTGDGRHEGG